MSIALLVITDGREDYLQRSLASLQEHTAFTFDQRVVIDDSTHTLGFAGAIQAGWEKIHTDHVLHLEADFTFNGPVDVEGMIDLLERQPHLAQVSLKRQPVNSEEIAAGGIVELHPDDFTQRSDGPLVWTEHRRYFTTNPSIYPSRLCRLGWPQEPNSEGVFTHKLLTDPLLRFAIWGAKFDPPLVEHIGAQRAGHSY